MKKGKTFQKAISIFTLSWPINLASFVFLITCFTTSCKKNNNISLERQLLGENSGGIYDTTINVSVETVQLDVLPSTKNRAYLTVGTFKDSSNNSNQDLLLSSKAFGQLSFVGFSAFEFATIDAVTIEVNYDYYLGNKSGKSLTFNVFPLTESIDSLTKYNSGSNIGYDSTKSLGTFNFTFKGSSDTVRATSNELKAILQNLKNTSNKEFTNTFKGVALVPTSQEGFGIGIPVLYNGFRVIVKCTLADNTPRSYTLSITNTSYRVNTTKIIKGSVSYGPTSITNNRAFLNYYLGIGAKVNIPDLSNFFNKIKNNSIITDAILEVPSHNSFQVVTSSPLPYLFAYQNTVEGNPILASDTSYKVLQSQFVSTGSNSETDLSGTMYGQRQQYYQGSFKFPIAHYLRDIQKGNRALTPYTLSVISDIGNFSSSAPTSYSFWDNSNTNGIKLKIYYSKIGL